MPYIILKERTAHLASYTFFARDVDQYKNMSLSKLYQPPRMPFSQNIITSYFCPVNIAKFLRTGLLWNTSRSSRFQIFSKIGKCILQKNFPGKHLCLRLF